MDNQVQLLADAIRNQESSGNYDALNSDSGAFGAYGFMPSTWEDTASRYGLDPSDKSPANQDAMALDLINEYWEKYHDPRAVASMWYSGSPDYTVNSDEGDYPTVSGYVQQVMNRMGQGGQTSFNFKAKDVNNIPFINLMANLRTNNPDEPFDYQGISKIIGQQNPNLKDVINKDRLTNEDYTQSLGSLPYDVAQYVKPHAEKLMEYRLAQIAGNNASNILQNNLHKGIEAVNLINKSNNIDNKNAYSSIMKQVGIDVPSNSDQYVTGNQLFGAKLQDLQNQRKWSLAQQKFEDAVNQENQKLGFMQQQIDHTNGLLSLYGGGK